jgi:hypothetical protein
VVLMLNAISLMTPSPLDSHCRFAANVRHRLSFGDAATHILSVPLTLEGVPLT